MTTYNTNSPTFGRQYFFSEVEASAINKRNKRVQTVEKQCQLQVRRNIDDILLSRFMGISIEDLNKKVKRL